MVNSLLHKAVIPAAGFGTRMLPAAKSVPKELLPILDRPTIQYVVEEAAAANLDDILLITSRDKRSIEDHFDRNPDLEDRLKSTGKESLLASIADLAKKVKIHATRQPQQRGLGDAIFTGPTPPTVQLTSAYQKLGTAIIGLEQVPPEKVDRYGIVAGEAVGGVGEGILRLHTLIEKPRKESAPSNYAIAARYLLTPGIFACLEQTPPGTGGEIQLTDALKLLLEKEPIHGVVLKSQRHDIGNPLDWLRTNLIVARRDPRLWEQLLQFMRGLLADSNQ